MKTSIIVAVADNWVIGKNNTLPWYIPADLKHFKETTIGHHIIMGQKTFESIGKPLPGRINIILSDNPNYKAKGCKVTGSLEEAFDTARKNNEKEVFIIGGSSVYKQTLPIADKLYLTKINHNFEGNIFFPKIDFSKWKQTSSKKLKANKNNPYSLEFSVYEKLHP